MFTVGSTLPIDGVEPGSTLLVVGPPMSGKRELMMELLSLGLDDEAVAVVTTDESAAEIRSTLADYTVTPAEALPLGVVDCLGEGNDSDLGPLDSRVSSPADLTGLGMAMTTLLEGLYNKHSRKLRVGIDSLTTMSMYSTPEQVIRFLHAVTGRVNDADAVGFVLAHSDTMDQEHLAQLRSFVDGVVEVREADGGTELRVVGLPGGNTDWVPFERAGRQTVGEADDTGIEAGTATATGGEPDDGDRQRVVSDDSLGVIFDDIRAQSPTLTVCNYDGPDEELAPVERYFDRQGVAVRRASLDVDQPKSVALLHHGEDLLGSESVPQLRADITVESESDLGERKSNDLLDRLDTSVFGATAADKPLLIDVSHTIELLANRTGSGRISAGFQRLSNLVDEEQAARIYERLGESGVDVHVFGTPDTETSLPGVTVHEEDSEEVRGSWFVVYDGDGDPGRKGALLAIERDDGTYEGFWTYDGDIVDRIDNYVSHTYIDGAAVGEQSGD